MTKLVRPSTYDALIEAAFAALNADPSASLADIATIAGVGRATLHRHFAGRDDLIQALSLQALEEMAEAADQASENAKSYTDALRKILIAIIPLGDRHWFLANEPMQRSTELGTEHSRQQKEFFEMIDGAKNEGLFHPACPAEWAAATYDHLVHAAWELVRNGHATNAQAADLAWATLTKGLKQAKLGAP